MRAYSVHDRRGNPVSLEQVRPDDGMRTLDLVVDGLADVVKQARQLCDADVGADLGRHHRREIGHLFGMVEHLLSVAGAETKDAEVTNDLRMQTLKTELQDRRLPLLFDPLQDLQAGLGDDLLDASRVNTAIHDALDRLRDDLASSSLAFVASRQLRFADLARNFVAQVLLDLRHQDSLSLLARHVRDALKLLFLLAVALLELRLDVVERLLLIRELTLGPIDVLCLPVEVLLLLEKAPFDLL